MVRSFTVRKEAKQHGTGKLIEGAFLPGDRVVIIEDVITTGGSALKAVEAVRAAGGDIQGVLALVDREEGGRAGQREHDDHDEEQPAAATHDANVMLATSDVKPGRRGRLA